MSELDSLANLDLGGVTGHIFYNYNYDPLATMLPGMLIGIGALLAFVLFLLFVASLVTPTKSQRYRETLADMYVVGTIKKLAKEDDIDLINELKEFAKSVKKKKLEERYGVDGTISAELKERVAAKMEKSLVEIETQTQNKEQKK